MDQEKPGGLNMADIPLDLQRRFERRWAARFVRAAAPKKQELERQNHQLTEPGRAKEKPTGLSQWYQVCTSGVSAGPNNKCGAFGLAL